MAAKIIVVGSAAGNLDAVLGKLATLHAKNQFSFAILCGNVFGEENDETVTKLLSGNLTVPLTTYFTVGTTPLPSAIIARIKDDEEICPNLHFLGKRSITKTSDGLRIVTLGGSLDDRIIGGQSKEQHLPLHTVEDAKALRGANTADVLLTAVWPSGVWQGSKTSLGAKPGDIPATEGVAELCAALRPRYHLTASAGEFFYEREPFFHPPAEDGKAVTSAQAVTRFISLAPFGNAAKAKAMYAFNLQGGGDTSVAIPIGSTMSPFFKDRGQQSRKRRAPDETDHDPYSRFAHGKRAQHRREMAQHGRRGKRQKPGPDQCFFCLANPSLPLHMVCSIGDESYVASAKGPLPAPGGKEGSGGTFADRGLDFPCHVLVVPLPHAPTFSAMTEQQVEEAGGGAGAGGGDAAEKTRARALAEADAATERTWREMTRFREAIQAMVARRSDHKLGVVTWEISRSTGVHLHWQMVPVPAELVTKGLVEAGFKVEAENYGYPAITEQTGDAAKKGVTPLLGRDYFRVWTWADDGEAITGKCLVMRLDDAGDANNGTSDGAKNGADADVPPARRFDLQFGRRVVAKLLGLEQTRAVWQDCAQTVAEETRDAERFKVAFKDWDFTL